MLAKDRVYDFLAGLHHSLDKVRGCLLGLRPLPTIDEVFAEVRREEQRKKIMLGSPIPSVVESSALAVRPGDSRTRKPLWCDFCQKPYHTKATCWRIHGKPADWVPKSQRPSDGKGNFTVSKAVPKFSDDSARTVPSSASSSSFSAT